MSRRQKEKDSPFFNINGPPLWFLFLNFLRIGSTAFGGFMALISMVQNEIVERKKLLTHNEMLDGISLATILPGPIAVNVVAYVGYKLRGGPGALVSAFGVILPAFMLMVALSAAYFRWGQIPAVNKLFLGFIPAVTAVIACLLPLYKGGFYITLIIIVSAGLIGWLSFGPFSNLSAGTAENKPVRKRHRVKLLALNAPLAAVPLLALDAGLAVKLFLTLAGMSLLLFGAASLLFP